GLAEPPHRGGRRASAARLDGAADLVVELVQAPLQRVVDLVLPFAHQPHDHVSSSFFSSPASSGAGAVPAPSSALSRARSSSTCVPAEIAASSRSMSSPEDVKSSSAPDAGNSSTAAPAAR